MNEASPSTPRARAAEAISSLWWLPLLRGILLTILGIYALFQPGLSLMAFIQVLAIFALIDGGLAIVAGIMGWVESRVWSILRGALAIVIGLFVLAHPLVMTTVAAAVLAVMLGLQAIAGGVLEIFVAIRERKELEGEGWLILGGVLSVLFGVLLLTAPLASGMMLIRLLGGFAIVFGIGLVVNSFRLRKLGKHLAASV